MRKVAIQCPGPKCPYCPVRGTCKTAADFSKALSLFIGQKVSVTAMPVGHSKTKRKPKGKKPKNSGGTGKKKRRG